MVFPMDKVLVATVDGNCQAFLPDNDQNCGRLDNMCAVPSPTFKLVCYCCAPVQFAARHAAHCTEYCG